jgi:hypothetical protein
MKKPFWCSVIIFGITLLFLIMVNSIDFGSYIAFPEGIDNTPLYITQMRNTIDAFQKYNEIDGFISILSFCTSFIFGFLAKRRGESLIN